MPRPRRANGPGVARRAGFGLALVLALLASGPARALVDIQIGTCTIVVTGPGTLAASPDLHTLSTLNPGGRPARARVSTFLSGTVSQLTCGLVVQINCFRVSLVAPSQFSSYPANGAADSLVGGWRTQGSSAALNLLSAVVLTGTTDLELHLTATRTQGAFPAGFFQAEQTLLCE